jgi:hypothetical protein
MSPEQIAAGLTKGEKRAVLAADKAGRLPWYLPEKKSTGRVRIMLRTLLNLERAGVIQLHPPYLTPLGLAVRDALSRMEGMR